MTGSKSKIIMIISSVNWSLWDFLTIIQVEIWAGVTFLFKLLLKIGDNFRWQCSGTDHVLTIWSCKLGSGCRKSTRVFLKRWPHGWPSNMCQRYICQPEQHNYYYCAILFPSALFKTSQKLLNKCVIKIILLKCPIFTLKSGQCPVT